MKKEDILSKITDEETKKAVESVLDFAEKAAITAASGKQTKEDVENLIAAKMADLKIDVKSIIGLQDQFDTIGTSVNSLKEAGKTPEGKSIFEQVKANLTANIDKLKSLKAGEKTDFTFNLKSAPGTMLEGTNLVAGIPLEQRLPGFNPIPQRTPFIAQLIGSGQASSNVISWVYEVAGLGGAGGTLEGTAKNQIDASFAVANEDVKKRTVFVKVSEEMLEDVDFMASYITNTLLNQRLTLDVDNQILNGNNVNANFNGIITQANGFAAGIFAGTVTTPNLRDVILIAINQVKLANFNANVVVLNPSDLTALRLIKDLIGLPMYPELAQAEQSLGGLPVYTNTGVAQGYFLVMDGTKAVYYSKGGIQVKTGWENSDFTLNLRTILAEVRGCLVIETNDIPAFVYDSIATAKAAIEATT